MNKASELEYSSICLGEQATPPSCAKSVSGGGLVFCLGHLRQLEFTNIGKASSAVQLLSKGHQLRHVLEDQCPFRGMLLLHLLFPP